MTQTQADFLADLGMDAERVEVTTYRDGDRYFATIADGWWVAYGETAEEAQTEVLSQFRHEREKHHGR